MWLSDVSTRQYGTTISFLANKFKLGLTRQSSFLVLDSVARSVTLTAERGGKLMSSLTRRTDLETVEQSSWSPAL